MQKFKIILCVVTALLCYGTNVSKAQEGKILKTLTIRWQRLVNEKGQTCERCGSTQKELQIAFQSLEKSLAPLGIKVNLENKAIDPMTAARDVSQSNRIWIGERALEEWLDAQVGKSLCGSCCAVLGDSVECRTVTINGRTYEAIPAELIIKSGLLAAAHLMDTASSVSGCDSTKSSKKDQSAGCCQKKCK